MLGLPEILKGRAHQNVFLQSSQSFRKPRMQVCQQTVRRIKFDITRKMELNQSPSVSLFGWLDKTLPQPTNVRARKRPRAFEEISQHSWIHATRYSLHAISLAENL